MIVYLWWLIVNVSSFHIFLKKNLNLAHFLSKTLFIFQKYFFSNCLIEPIFGLEKRTGIKKANSTTKQLSANTNFQSKSNQIAQKSLKKLNKSYLSQHS